MLGIDILSLPLSELMGLVKANRLFGSTASSDMATVSCVTGEAVRDTLAHLE